MPKTTVQQVKETLQKEVHKMDRRVLVAGVEQSKKKDVYRVTLFKDGRSTSVDLKKEIVEQHLSQEDNDKGLKKALGKAVSHLSIRYQR